MADTGVGRRRSNSGDPPAPRDHRAERFAKEDLLVRGLASARSKPLSLVVMFMVVLQACSSGGATTAPSVGTSAAPGSAAPGSAAPASAAGGAPVSFVLWS